MRIWNFAVSLGFVALGLTSWRSGRWAGSEENYAGDASMQGLQELFFYGIGLGLFGLAVGVLFLRARHLASVLADAPDPGPAIEDGEVKRPGKAYDRLFE